MELESYIRSIYLFLANIYEAIDQKESMKLLINDFSAAEESGISSLIMLPYVGEFHSEVVGMLSRHQTALADLLGFGEMTGTDATREEQHLERILLNTPKIIFDRGLVPENEKAVRKAVYDVLVHVFPSTLREIPVPQVTKTYKPDIGVQSLKVAIEYKFSGSEEEVKKAVGGLYEDMRGYAGSEDWTKFYAVIYMSEPFFTIDQIMSEFKHTRADDNWVPILVHGAGKRRKEKAKSAAE